MKNNGGLESSIFATTALVATAGAAAADVTLTGRAEMGLFGGTGVAGDPAFFTDIDVIFTMSGTTDNGLTFGAVVDLDEALNQNAAGAFALNGALGNNRDDGGATFFISGDFGRLSMGDIDGALDNVLEEAWVGNAGSLNDDETSHSGALGAYGDGAYDGQILRYDYTIGEFGVSVSVEADDAGVRDNGYAIGFSYGFDFAGGSADIGLGYQTFDALVGATGTLGLGGAQIPNFGLPAGTIVAVDVVGVSADVTLDVGLSAGVQYAEFDAGAGRTLSHVGVGAGYTFDAITVSANWGEYDYSRGGASSGYGLAASYNLGGGLRLHAGYGLSELIGGRETSAWSFGAAMSF